MTLPLAEHPARCASRARYAAALAEAKSTPTNQLFRILSKSQF
jgi:hypothetical protein